MYTRRSLNLKTEVYEDLSFLQAETRLLMKEKGITKILSKTSAANILTALIKNTSPKDLIKMIEK